MRNIFNVLGLFGNGNKKNEDPTEEEAKKAISDTNAEPTTEICQENISTSVWYVSNSKPCEGKIFISRIIEGKEIKFCGKCLKVVKEKKKGKPPP